MTDAPVLSTGWERDVPVTDSLARRFVFAYADRICDMARRTGGRTAERDGAMMADLSSPFGYDNAVVLTAPPRPEQLPALLAAAESFFPPERWWVLLSLFPTPDLGPSGLLPVGHPPLMLRPPAPAPPAPAGLDVRPRTANRSRRRAAPRTTASSRSTGWRCSRRRGAGATAVRSLRRPRPSRRSGPRC